MREMKYKLAIFDLDGTVLNTLDDLCDSLNAVLQANNLPLHSKDAVRRFVGNGGRKLIERAVADESMRETVFNQYIPYYQQHCLDKTAEYPGVSTLLDELNDAGMICAVVSNKGDEAVKPIIAHFFPGKFVISVGECQGIRKKPYPDGVNEILKQLNIKKEDAVYIGDSEVDLQTAAAAQMDCISVCYGFRSEEELKENGATQIAHTPDEIKQYL